MPLVVFDTNILLPGLLGQGNPRRLLCLAAYGAICHRHQELQFENDELAREAASIPGARVGGPHGDALRERIEDARSRIEKRIKVHAPACLRIATSPQLLDELERKLREVRIPPAPLEPGKARAERLLVASLTTRSVELADTLDPYVPDDPADDVVLHTAWRTEAEFIVTDNHRDFMPYDGERQRWEDKATGASVIAIRPDIFIAEQVATSNFELAQIDPALLVEFLRAVAQVSDPPAP